MRAALEVDVIGPWGLIQATLPLLRKAPAARIVNISSVADEDNARPAADSARGVVWAATLDEDGPTGGFFRDGQLLKLT